MNLIKRYRTSLDPTVTQQQLGDEVGQTKTSICNYEKGRRNPELSVSRAIVAALSKLGAKNDDGYPVTLDDVFPPEEGQS